MTASPEQLVTHFLSEYQLSKTYSRSRISALAELAISEYPGVADSANRALFKSLIERLADSFEPENVSLYNRVFSQLTQRLRLDPRAKALDAELTHFKLNSEEELLERAESLRQVRKLNLHNWNESLKCVLVLSRVTLGADVAITSVILERIKLLFPSAEIFLLGGSKCAELFGGDSRVRLEEITYRSGGTTIERLLSWTALVDRVRSITQRLSRAGYLIIDPDTRLTQLGLLPLVEPTDLQFHSNSEKKPNYVFFPSREYGHDTSLSLAELTSRWLDEVFGVRASTYPRVSLNEIDIDSARALIRHLRGPAGDKVGRRVVAINFGTGGNSFKNVSENFEASLVSHFIREGSAVVFDKGAGDEEARRAKAVLAEATRIKRNGVRARLLEINEHNLSDALSSEHPGADILVWDGRIGMLSALIGESDLYIGYDSAGQHIAAALGVPCIDVFAGASSPRMLDRWKPTGKGETRVIPVDTRLGSRAAEDLSSQLFEVANELPVRRA